MNTTGIFDQFLQTYKKSGKSWGRNLLLVLAATILVTVIALSAHSAIQANKHPATGSVSDAAVRTISELQFAQRYAASMASDPLIGVAEKRTLSEVQFARRYGMIASSVNPLQRTLSEQQFADWYGASTPITARNAGQRTQAEVQFSQRYGAQPAPDSASSGAVQRTLSELQFARRYGASSHAVNPFLRTQAEIAFAGQYGK